MYIYIYIYTRNKLSSHKAVNIENKLYLEPKSNIIAWGDTSDYGNIQKTATIENNMYLEPN